MLIAPPQTAIFSLCPTRLDSQIAIGDLHRRVIGAFNDHIGRQLTIEAFRRVLIK